MRQKERWGLSSINVAHCRQKLCSNKKEGKEVQRTNQLLYLFHQSRQEVRRHDYASVQTLVLLVVKSPATWPNVAVRPSFGGRKFGQLSGAMSFLAPATKVKSPRLFHCTRVHQIDILCLTSQTRPGQQQLIQDKTRQLRQAQSCTIPFEDTLPKQTAHNQKQLQNLTFIPHPSYHSRIKWRSMQHQAYKECSSLQNTFNCLHSFRQHKVTNNHFIYELTVVSSCRICCKSWVRKCCRGLAKASLIAFRTAW